VKPPVPDVVTPLASRPGGGELLHAAISDSEMTVKRGPNEDGCIA
jgi:hypothetical protein